MHDPISTSFNHYRAKTKWMYVCKHVNNLLNNCSRYDIQKKVFIAYTNLVSVGSTLTLSYSSYLTPFPSKDWIASLTGGKEAT